MAGRGVFGTVGHWLFGHDRSIGFGLESLGLLTLRFPRVLAVVVIAITAFCLAQLPKASVDGDLLRVYAHSGPDYDAYRDLASTFGTFENDVYVLVRSPTLTSPETIEEIRTMALSLTLSDYLSGSMSAFTLRKPGPDGGTLPVVPEGMTTPEQVEAALTDLQRNDPLMRNFINPDLSGVVIILFPNHALVEEQGSKAMIDDLRGTLELFASENLQVELTGPPVWTAEMLNATVDDQIKFTIYGFSLGALIALLSLRSLWGALLVSATPFIAVFWVMGLVVSLYGSFTFLTIIVTTLILVITFAESLFFIFAWLGYWRDGMDPHAALDKTMRVIGPATALTMLTTLVAFASLSLTPGQGIGEFSVAGSIACLTSFVAMMTFLPLILKLAVRLGLKLPKPPSLAVQAPIPVAWALATRFGRPLAVLSVLATILMFVPYVLIEPRFSIEDYMTRDSAALAAAEDIDSGVGGVAPIYISVPLREGIPNIGDEDFETVKVAHAIVEGHIGQNKVVSAASYKFYEQSGFSRDDILNAVGELKARFVTPDGMRALVTGFMPTIISSQEIKTLVEGIGNDLRAAGIEGAKVGGFRILTTYGTESIVRGLQLCLTLSVIVNLFLIGLAFRSWRIALVTAIPNLFPVLGTEAWLWSTGQGLQLTTVLSLTIAFGIAVDDTTHFLSHYLHSRRVEGKDHREAVRFTMDRIGGAIVATTLILCSGTAIVMFSALPQVALFGTLFVITLALALLGDVFILPALLIAGGRFFHPLGGMRK